MKKSIYYILSVLCLAVLLSCSDDDDIFNEYLNGTWEGIDTIGAIGGSGVYTNYYSIEFKDNTFICSAKRALTRTGEEEKILSEEIIEGTYTYKELVVFFSSDAIGSRGYISEENKTLHLDIKGSYNRIVFTKKQ